MTTFNSTMRQANRRLVVTVGGAALALAALAGVAGYQVGLHSHAGVRQAVTQPVTQRDGLAAGNVSAATGSTGAVRTSEHPMLVLVGSPEQAQAVQRGVDEADAIRATMGVGPLPQTVQQVTSAADAATWARSIADENLTRVSLGLPEIQVQDLRPVSAAVTTGHGVVFSTVEIPTLVLVGSAEQAQAQQRGIDEADAIRATMGVGPLPQTVQQVTSAADAATWARSIADENLTRVSLGLPEIQVQDLRN